MRIRGRSHRREKNHTVINIVISCFVMTLLFATGYSAFQTVTSIIAKGSIKDMLKEYNQNQLLIHLDGIKNTRTGHRTNITHWEDLSGNNNDGEVIDGTWDSDSMIYNGTTTGIYYSNTLKDLFNISNTIEIRLIFNESNTRDVIIGNYNYLNNLNYEKSSSRNILDKSRIWLNGGQIDKDLDITYRTGIALTVSFVYDKQNNELLEYIDGEFIDKVDGLPELKNLSDFAEVYIGRDSRTGDTVLNGKIYSVRIYQRLLSANEIRRNYETDKKRFK